MNKLIDSGYSVTLTRFFSLFVGFVFNGYVAKSLGADVSGLFFLSFSIISFIAIVFRFGLDTFTLRAVSISRNASNLVVYCGFFIISSIVVYFFTEYIFVSILDNDIILSVRDLWPLIFSINIVAVITQAFTALNKPTLGVALSTLITPLLSLLLLFFFKDQISYDNFIQIYVFSFIITAFSSVFVLFKIQKEPIIINLSCIYTDSIKSKSYYFSSIFSALNSFFPIILLGLLSSNEDVSWYSLSMRIAAACGVVMTSFCLFYSPKLRVSYIDTGWDNIQYQYNMIFKKVNFILQPIIIIAFLISILFFMYLGDEYLPAIYVTFILLIAQVFNGFFGISGSVLNMTGKEDEQMKSIMLSFFILLVLVPFSAIYAGAIGVSISYLLANVIGNFRSYIILNKMFN